MKYTIEDVKKSLLIMILSMRIISDLIIMDVIIPDTMQLTHPASIGAYLKPKKVIYF